VIPVPRLEVEPWARHCVRCQELEEQGLLADIEPDLDEEEETEAADSDADDEADSSDEEDGEEEASA
jgi:hypothetical protein